MENKFTPGPWVPGGKLPYKGNESWIFDSSNPEKLVATVRPWESTIPMEEAFANAHLIAAATELLVALMNIFDFPSDDIEAWINGEHPITITILPSHIGDAQKAIKKALNQL